MSSCVSDRALSRRVLVGEWAESRVFFQDGPHRRDRNGAISKQPSFHGKTHKNFRWKEAPGWKLGVLGGAPARISRTPCGRARGVRCGRGLRHCRIRPVLLLFLVAAQSLRIPARLSVSLAARVPGGQEAMTPFALRIPTCLWEEVPEAVTSTHPSLLLLSTAAALHGLLAGSRRNPPRPG